jgi:hypothetical protein
MAALLAIFIPAAGHAQAPASVPAPVLVAKIATNLSTKNAKPGDVITAKTLKSAKLTDGTEIPKGSKLTGKVTTVQSKKAGNGTSMLSFRIDQVEPKGGAAIPIKGLVVAIGPSLAPKDLFGANSVMARNTNPQPGTGVTSGSQGTGSSNGLDPNLGLGNAGAKDEDDIPLGSRLEGVSLGRHMDADWTTALEGIHTDIDLDSEVLIKVQLK